MVLLKKALQNLADFKDKKVIKVITGIRRCGKSTLLSQHRDFLQSGGVKEKQIIALNFESVQWEHLKTYHLLSGRGGFCGGSWAGAVLLPGVSGHRR